MARPCVLNLSCLSPCNFSGAIRAIQAIRVAYIRQSALRLKRYRYTGWNRIVADADAALASYLLVQDYWT